jgi:hypothetical protein
MIRSFTTLARTLNLSHAVKELGSTRQTLRRHISQLEEARGEPLFLVEDRQYQLTEAGERALPEALEILARGNSWLNAKVSHFEGLQHLTTATPSGWFLDQQQHPLSKIWSYETPIMREAFRAWAMSSGNIEADEMAHVRPYLIVYRYTSERWICVEFGEESFYVKWFGWAKARSSIGQPVGGMPGGADFARMLEQPFLDVQTTQSARLDHVATLVPHEVGGELFPVNYRRLLLGGRFPDGSPALFSLTEPTAEIEIPGLDPSKIATPSADIVLDFDVKNAKYER